MTPYLINGSSKYPHQSSFFCNLLEQFSLHSVWACCFLCFHLIYLINPFRPRGCPDLRKNYGVGSGITRSTTARTGSGNGAICGAGNMDQMTPRRAVKQVMSCFVQQNRGLRDELGRLERPRSAPVITPYSLAI